MTRRFKIFLSLYCLTALWGTQAMGVNSLPNNSSPVDWATADWRDTGGVPVGVPGGSLIDDDVKIGRTFAGSVVGPTTDVVVNLNGQAGTANQLHSLEINTYNSGTPAKSATLNILSTGGGTLQVGIENVQLGRNGTGVATLYQSGGSFDSTGGTFSQNGFDTLADFAGGTAVTNRVKVGATPGNVWDNIGNDTFRVSGGDVSVGSGSVFADIRLYPGSRLEVTGGTMTGVYDAVGGSPVQIFEYAVFGEPAVDPLRAQVEVSGGIMTGIDSFLGPDVTINGGTFIVGDDVLAGVGVDASDRTALQSSQQFQKSPAFTMTSGNIVFPIASNGNAAQLRMNDDTTVDLTGGTVDVDFTNFPAPYAGLTVELIQALGFNSPTLSTANIGPAPAGLAWDTSDWLTSYSLTLVEGVADNGDFDNDGDVDGNDFLVWQRDPNVGDLAVWQDDFGTIFATANVASVPEPASAALLILGGLAMWVRKRHG